ncbi:MAG: ATP-binding protein [Terriglobales bacterium]
MRLKTKLIIALSLLVLVVVATASGLYLASILREQMSGIYANADFVSREIFNEVRQEVQSAAAAGLVDLRQPADAEQFMSGLDQSASLTTLMNSAIGYPVTSAVRDVAVVNADGRVLADSDPQLVGQILPPRSQLQAVTGGSWWRQLQAIFGAEEVYEVSLPLLLGTHPLGAIRVGVDTALVRAALASRIRAISFYGLLIVVVATLLAVAFSDFALSPLNALSAQLDRVARGEEAALGTARWGSEVGRVSSKIELLGRQIQDARQIYTHLQESVTQVLEGLEEGVVLFGPDGRALMASAAAQRFLAMAPAQVVGRPVEEVFPSQSSLDRAVRVAVQQETTLGLREVERQPGARRLLARVDRLGEGERASALLVLRDAERVHRLEDLVEVARRLSAVGRLTHGVAHEVKNPLNAMAIHLDLLRAKAQGQGLEQHLDIMRHELDRLDWVVKTFLDFTRPVEVRLRPVDLAEVAAGVRDLVADEAATRGIEVEVESEGPVMLWADRDLVEQVLLNLVNNGIEASADGLAKANGRRGGGARVVMAVGREGDEAVARVRDQGAGVEEEIRDKIFDLYFSTKANGSGLGLAIAARVMQLHNGSIELEPSDGTEAGATFCLRFPVREGAAAEAAAEEGAEAEA